MKFLRVIRFDHSDDNVYDRPAQTDEWAVSGGFEFADIEREQLVGKTRQAFANGFLGVPSFGRSTFCMVADMTDAEHDALANQLARHFVDQYGAPEHGAALGAAEDELAFVCELCAAKPVNTVFTVRRVLEDGQLREEFREITPPGEPRHTRIWDVVEDEA